MQTKASSHSLPAARLLSNGHLHSVVTSSGTGCSSYDWVALNRWRPDPTQDALGYFLYLRDLDDGSYWSLTGEPAGRANDSLETSDRPGIYGITSSHRGIQATLEIAIAPDSNIEIRRVRLGNNTEQPRRIEITSYLEVVLNHPAADEAHPAFSKLFVQTYHDEKSGALLAHRRSRSEGEPGLWLIHAAIGGADPQFETDRSRFIGRGNSLADPGALKTEARLSGGIGNVLDPVFSLRRTLELAPAGTEEISFGLGAADDRDLALKLRQSISTQKKIESLFARAEKRELKLLADLDLSQKHSNYLQSLAANLVTGMPHLRAPAELLARAKITPGAFDRQGIPSWGMHVVVMASHCQDEVVWEFIKARRYWEAKGIPVTLVIFAERDTWRVTDEPVFVRSAADMPRCDFESILANARLVVIDRKPEPFTEVLGVFPKRSVAPNGDAIKDLNNAHLRFFNGYGGFSREGNEYVVDLRSLEDSCLKLPPAPWINVVANEHAGFLISEIGAGYTWCRNSRERRLTHWSNDPVLDPHSEALYVRDNADGAWWSPTPGPAPAGNDYQACHGFGYTRFVHQSHHLSQETTFFVPRHDPVKIVCVRLTNNTDSQRQLSLYSYQHLILGNSAQEHGRHIVSEYDSTTKTLLATSRRADAFADGFVFATALADCPYQLSHTADRTAFLGQAGTLSSPQSLQEPALDGKTGAGLNSCLAMQVDIELAPWEEADCFFLIGETTNRRAALDMATHYRSADVIADALSEVRQFWTELTDAVQIQTPSEAIDVLLNGWLTYQNLACRIWGRSAFYQSGGAYGYRDQLQDASALIFTRPDLTRQQIMLHAAHQFVEGDVLHWWHPAPLETGLRTRFSDDLLWLPYVTAYYLASTGDFGLLDEMAPFVTARELEPGEDEAYLKPTDAGQSGDIYLHCCRALDRALTIGCGDHDLPLMGTGDWNDGMSRVGREGRGESVWMGFFLVRVITDFLPICEHRVDTDRIAWYRSTRDQLSKALNDHGWDGEWYRRAYYDNGAVMGSKDSDECQIDALAQAWSVISGVAPPTRAQSALDAVERRLISDADGIIKLLTPPFVDTVQDPGYIKGYVAGVRENGGQYTHAACWVIRAMAEAGRSRRAVELLEKIGPIHHTFDQEKANIYKVEPYVVAADIYGESPHVGRGGWTWYTGSASWMYRVTLESILGIRYEHGTTLVICPRIPESWPEYRVKLRAPQGRGHYDITVKNPESTGQNVIMLKIDGMEMPVEGGIARIPLTTDEVSHRIQITLGNLATGAAC